MASDTTKIRDYIKVEIVNKKDRNIQGPIQRKNGISLKKETQESCQSKPQS